MESTTAKQAAGQVTVTLESGDTVMARRVTWGGWMKIKSAFLRGLAATECRLLLAGLVKLAAQPVSVRLLEAVTAKDDGTELGIAERKAEITESAIAFLQTLSETEIVSLIPGGAAAISESIDNITGDLLENAIVGADGVQAEDLSAEEVIELRDAAVKANDFRGLLDREKNSVGGLVAQFAETIQSLVADEA